MAASSGEDIYCRVYLNIFMIVRHLKKGNKKNRYSFTFDDEHFILYERVSGSANLQKTESHRNRYSRLISWLQQLTSLNHMAFTI